MVIQSTDVTPTPVTEATETPRGFEVLPTKCHICTRDLKHAEVVLLGHSSEDKEMAVHPNCLIPGKNDGVKDLKLVHVHVEKGKRISPAKMIVVKKTMKAIYKAIAMANAKKNAERKQA